MQEKELSRRLQAGICSLVSEDKNTALSALTEITGAVHEDQLYQLKMYGLAFSASVVSCSIEPDHERKVIRYIVEVEPAKVEKDLGRRIALLKKAVAVIMQGWGAEIRMRQKGTVTNED